MGSTVEGAEVLGRNIVLFTEGFLREVNRDMYQVSGLLSKTMRGHISLTDHSLEDLAEMGHPYASRHGGNGMGLHTPNWEVHTQSGEMLGGFIDGVEDADVSDGQLTAEAWAGVADYVEHAKSVVFGTSKMIPRDFLTGTLHEVKEQSVEILRRSMKNMVVSFQGEKVKL